jgi:2'-5' RNA ligase
MSSLDSVGGDERSRLFCALRLPATIIERLAPWQEENLTGGRLVRPEDLHITLAFLGHRPASELPAITTELRAAAKNTQRPTFKVRRYHETPRVGMLILDEQHTSHGAALAYDLQQRLETLGIALKERRPWKAHVTVIRFRERPRLAPPMPELGTFKPSDAAVYISRLRPSGAQYHVLEAVALGG